MINQRLERTFGIYIIGSVLITVCSFFYFYFKSNLVFILIIVLVFLVSYLMSVWFQLFFNSKPYIGKYRQPLLDFAKKNGFSLKDIYIRQSNHYNACSFGLFNNKAVTFNSLTLAKCPWSEIEGLMAHELGHHAYFSMYIYTAIVAGLLILLTLVNFSIYSYFGRNLIQLFYICLITTIFALPFALAISRYMEGLADRYAIKILKDPSTFGRFLERLLRHEEKLGESFPKNPTSFIKLFTTHPWIYDRIRLSKNKQLVI